MGTRALRLPQDTPYRALIGVGGIGTGLFFALEGDHTLGRNESRPGRLLDVRDYCKLHIIAHYAAVLLGARASGSPFHVLPVGKVGDDPPGRRMIEEMAAAGMDTRFVDVIAGRPTLFSVCFQYPDGSGGNITTADSAAAALSPDDVERCRPLFEARAGRVMALAAPEAPLDARRSLLALATQYGAFRAAAFTSAEMPDARKLGLFGLIDLVSMNEDEAAALTGSGFDKAAPAASLDACSAQLAAVQPRVRIVVTAGRGGAYGFADGVWRHRPAYEADAVSTAGAGDALLGGLLAATAAGMPFFDALDFATLLAAFTTTSPHTIHPGADAPALAGFAGRLGVPLSEPLWRALFDPA